MTATSTTDDIIQRTLNYTTKFITTTLTKKGEEKDHHISRLGWLKWLVNKYRMIGRWQQVIPNFIFCWKLADTDIHVKVAFLPGFPC